MLRRLLIALAALSAASLLSLFLVTRPTVLNLLGRAAEPLLGFRFELADLDLSPHGARAAGLKLSSAGFEASIQTASVGAELTRLRIEEVTIEGATFRYVYDPSAPAFSYQQYVSGLPSLGRLTVRNTTADIVSKDGAWTAEATSISATLQDFSPEGGGKLSFSSRVRLLTKDGATDAAGKVSGSGSLSALLPRPVGRASLEAELAGKLAGRAFKALSLSLPLEASQAGLVRLATGRVSAQEVQLAEALSLKEGRILLPASVDLVRRQFEVSGARAKIFGGLGDIKLEASGGWEPGSPLGLDWQARLAADTLEVARLRELAAPLAPELAQWQAQGTASLSAELEGRYREGLTYEGELRLRLAQVSFSSPDFTKAGENIAASLLVRLKSQALQRADLEAALALTQGQLLAGEILADASLLKPTVTANGSFFLTAALPPSPSAGS